MVIGKKFWKINAAGDYNPASSPGIALSGILSGSSITNVDPAIVTAIAALIATPANVGISGNYINPGTRVTVAAGTTLTLSQSSAVTSKLVTNLRYWNAEKPSAAGGDGAIQALLCLDNNHNDFIFIDSSGKAITIPSNTMVKGAIYYFQIMQVTTVTASQFIGYSAI